MSEIEAVIRVVLGAALVNETAGIYAPDKLEGIAITYSPPLDIEEMTCGVVHPVTKETLTKYQQLNHDPLLRDVWMKAMCIKLGRLVQGYEGTKGTDTIRFLSHHEIAQLSKDRTITYARIVVDYRPQKEDKE